MTADSRGAPRPPTGRFSDRVPHYVRSRPGYPAELMALLGRDLGLTEATVVADVGSGTGVLTRMFLEAGHEVYAVEPNRAMREAAEKLLREFSRFHSLDGAAEATGLEDAAVDLVAAAQAFHWFDHEAARREFRRILRPGGCVVLVWNRRRCEGAPFLEAYEDLLVRRSIDYEKVDHRTQAGPEALSRFFRGPNYEARRFDNHQRLDWEGLRHRALSSSYVPMPDHPGHEAMMRELRVIFDRWQESGFVRIDYDTEVYHGTLGDPDPARSDAGRS